jgi:ABC-2 type transport system permease protein
MQSAQIRTIVWLRWRLTVNQLRRGGTLNALLAAALGVVVLALAIGAAVIGTFAGAWGLVKARPLDLLAIYDVLVCVFLFLWMISIVAEIQRSETISIGRLLHLPVSLRGVFVVNYLASHLALSVILLVPAMVGLALGLAVRHGPVMLYLIPLVLAFVFMITAWTYCLRGWLVSLMVNPRHRRAVIAYVTMGFVLLTQAPNLLGHLMRHDRRHGPDRSPADSATQGSGLPNSVRLLHQVLPVGWVGYGAMHAATGSTGPALLGTAGGLVIGALGLRRAYRSTVRFYHGEHTARPGRRRAKAEKTTGTALDLVERHWPGIPQEAANLAQVFFRCLIRAPEIKMALVTNIIFLLIAFAGIVMRRSGPSSEVIRPFIATGAVAFAFLGMLQPMFNQFGCDREGFRCLVLSPVPRHLILLGKNLALLPLILGIGLALLAAATVLARIGLLTVAAACLQVAAAFLLLSTIGNALSSLTPFRVAPGSLKPTKTRTTTTFTIVLSHLLLFPVTIVPLFLGPVLGWWLAGGTSTSAQLVNLAASVALLVVLALAYRISLAPLGRLLARREKEILRVVTQQVE